MKIPVLPLPNCNQNLRQKDCVRFFSISNTSFEFLDSPRMSRMDRSARSVSQPRGKRDSSVSSAYGQNGQNGGAGGTNKTKQKIISAREIFVETEEKRIEFLSHVMICAVT